MTYFVRRNAEKLPSIFLAVCKQEDSEETNKGREPQQQPRPTVLRHCYFVKAIFGWAKRESSTRRLNLLLMAECATKSAGQPRFFSVP